MDMNLDMMQLPPVPCDLAVGFTSYIFNPSGLEDVWQVQGAEQHVMAKCREAPEGLPGIGEHVVLEEDSVLEAGAWANVTAHDVNAVVMQCTCQVQAGL